LPLALWKFMTCKPVGGSRCTPSGIRRSRPTCRQRAMPCWPRAKRGRLDKRTRHHGARKACLHVGLTRHAPYLAPCREGIQCRIGIDECACLPRAASCSGGAEAKHSVGISTFTC
jgi:hypothetical protein